MRSESLTEMNILCGISNDGGGSTRGTGDNTAHRASAQAKAPLERMSRIVAISVQRRMYVRTYETTMDSRDQV